MIEMNRRGFLLAVLATGVAPAIVRASSLMGCKNLILPEKEIVICENEKPVIATGDFLKSGRMSAPSYIDIVSGETESVNVDGIVYRTYKRRLS